jgi:signal peptidase
VQKPGDTKSAGQKLTSAIALVICILLIPLLIVNLTIILKSFANPDKVPGFLGFKPLIVLSGSMEPAILTGDLVIVREVPADTLKEGDVIAFRRATAVITHRIMKINQNDGNTLFYTKGDNNNADDSAPVTVDLLEGRYLFRIPAWAAPPCSCRHRQALCCLWRSADFVYLTDFMRAPPP